MPKCAPKIRAIIELRRPRHWPYVKHYHFHSQDRQWGHLIVRICGYQVLKPVLAGTIRRQGRPPKHLSRLDKHYQALREELARIFETIGLAE